MISSTLPEFVLDDDFIADADRLCHRELYAGEKIAQHRPRRKAGNDAGDAGRREQRHAELAHRIERHQREADGHQEDRHLEHAQQDADLRDVLARQEVVLDVEPEPQQIEIRRDLERGHRGPAQQADGGEPDEAGEHVLGVAAERRRR